MGPFITLTRRELAGHFLSFRGYVILQGNISNTFERSRPFLPHTYRLQISAL